MLDIKYIREHTEAVRKAITNKRINLNLDEVLEQDRAVLELKSKVESLQAERNANAKAVPKAAKEDKGALIEKGKALGEELKGLEPGLREAEEKLRALLLRVPNVPLASVPEGADDSDNVELRREGKLPEFSFKPLDQVELLEKHGWADFERVARVSGSRSYLLKGEAALLEQAILMYAMSFLAGRGLTPLSTTALIRPETLLHSGHFPGDEESVYTLPADDLMLAGTAEVPINSLYAGEILAHEQLPLAFAGLSAAFRREAGSAGRDVRGLIRVHEFRKVEQYVMCTPETAMTWFEAILENAESILHGLEIPYRIIQNCTGDMGAGKVLMYDIEAWVPSEGVYRETHSCSYLGDWQARRTGLRYRDENGKVQFVHTLNNTGIAAPRILVPFLENNQQEDGRVHIPVALRPYLGGKEFIGG